MWVRTVFQEPQAIHASQEIMHCITLVCRPTAQAVCAGFVVREG